MILRRQETQTNMSDNLFMVGFIIFLSFTSLVSILAALKSDANGCSVSPDNAGCVLNRPVDLDKRHLSPKRRLPALKGL